MTHTVESRRRFIAGNVLAVFGKIFNRKGLSIIAENIFHRLNESRFTRPARAVKEHEDIFGSLTEKAVTHISLKCELQIAIRQCLIQKIFPFNAAMSGRIEFDIFEFIIIRDKPEGHLNAFKIARKSSEVIEINFRSGHLRAIILTRMIGESMIFKVDCAILEIKKVRIGIKIFIFKVNVA